MKTKFTIENNHSIDFLLKGNKGAKTNREKTEKSDSVK